MIAGDAGDRGRHDASRSGTAASSAASVLDRRADVPECPSRCPPSHVTFPSCWDGKNLDSADYQSHVAYPVAGRCPSRYAHRAAAALAHLPLPGHRRRGPHARLGRAVLAHADFFNAWRQSDCSSPVDSCLNAFRHCQRGT